MRDFLRIKFGVPPRRSSVFSQVSEMGPALRAESSLRPVASAPSDALAAKHYSNLQPALHRIITGTSEKWHNRLRAMVSTSALQGGAGTWMRVEHGQVCCRVSASA